MREKRETGSWKNSQRSVQTQQLASRVYLVKLLSLHGFFKWVCVLVCSCDVCVGEGEQRERSNSRVLERLILYIDVDGISFSEWRNCEGEFEKWVVRRERGQQLCCMCALQKIVILHCEITS